MLVFWAKDHNDNTSFNLSEPRLFFLRHKTTSFLFSWLKKFILYYNLHRLRHRTHTSMACFWISKVSEKCKRLTWRLDDRMIQGCWWVELGSIPPTQYQSLSGFCKEFDGIPYELLKNVTAIWVAGVWSKVQFFLYCLVPRSQKSEDFEVNLATWNSTEIR